MNPTAYIVTKQHVKTKRCLDKISGTIAGIINYLTITKNSETSSTNGPRKCSGTVTSNKYENDNRAQKLLTTSICVFVSSLVIAILFHSLYVELRLLQFSTAMKNMEKDKNFRQQHNQRQIQELLHQKHRLKRQEQELLQLKQHLQYLGVPIRHNLEQDLPPIGNIVDMQQGTPIITTNLIQTDHRDDDDPDGSSVGSVPSEAEDRRYSYEQFVRTKKHENMTNDGKYKKGEDVVGGENDGDDDDGAIVELRDKYSDLDDDDGGSGDGYNSGYRGKNNHNHNLDTAHNKNNGGNNITHIHNTHQHNKVSKDASKYVGNGNGLNRVRRQVVETRMGDPRTGKGERKNMKGTKNVSEERSTKRHGLNFIHLEATSKSSRTKESESQSERSFSFWKKATWVTLDHTKRFFHLDESTGHVSVEKAGAYLVYVQVLYHDAIGRWSLGVVVNSVTKLKCLETEQLRDIVDYHPTSHGVYKQCSATSIIYLEARQTVSIKCMYGQRTILTQPEFTFWGLIKLT